MRLRSHYTGKKGFLNWRQKLSLSIIFCVGVLLSFYVFHQIRRYEINTTQQRFNEMGNSRIELFEDKIHNLLDHFNAVAAFYRSSDNVRSDEFRAFANETLLNERVVISIEWLPRVLREQRAAFENEVQKNGYADFCIRDVDLAGQFICASNRDVYFPALFVEPFEANQSMYGFDYSSRPARFEAMEKAREQNKPIGVVSSDLVRSSDEKETDGIHLFMPIYKSASDANDVKGYLLLVSSISRLMTATFEHEESALAEIHLFMRSGNELKLLYPQKTDDRYRIKGLWADQLVSIRREFEFAGHRWVIEFYPTTTFVQQQALNGSFFAGGISFLMVLLFTAYLHTLFSRTAKVERLVGLRTAELRKALARVKTLSGLLPICASCKKIRDDRGYWHQVEYYIKEHSDAEFSHGLCPDCSKKLYPEVFGEAKPAPDLTK